MSDQVELTCPRCKHEWWRSLNRLEKLENVIVYRGEKEKAKNNITKYRAKCPVDGTYIIVEIKED